MTVHDEISRWFRFRIPESWFAEPVTVSVDREEILVVGTLATPELDAGLPAAALAAALAERIKDFREGSREGRVAIAREAEHRFARKVSWGARCHGREEVFTIASVPAMTRLRMPERAVLDTLIDAGIARSRSEALAWCVRLVGRHEHDWIEQLRAALTHVGQVRDAGPTA